MLCLTAESQNHRTKGQLSLKTSSGQIPHTPKKGYLQLVAWDGHIWMYFLVSPSMKTTPLDFLFIPVLSHPYSSLLMFRENPPFYSLFHVHCLWTCHWAPLKRSLSSLHPPFSFTLMRYALSLLFSRLNSLNSQHVLRSMVLRRNLEGQNKKVMISVSRSWSGAEWMAAEGKYVCHWSRNWRKVKDSFSYHQCSSCILPVRRQPWIYWTRRKREYLKHMHAHLHHLLQHTPVMPLKSSCCSMPWLMSTKAEGFTVGSMCQPRTYRRDRYTEVQSALRNAYLVWPQNEVSTSSHRKIFTCISFSTTKEPLLALTTTL